MNINITIGQFYPVDSAIHRLDPRTKLMACFSFIVLLFVASNFWSYLIGSVGLGAVILLSNVPPKYMFKGLRGLIGVIMFTVILNLFFVPGEHIIFQFAFLKITIEGLITAGNMACRLILLIVASSILTLSTSPIELTDAIEYILKPLKKIGVPGHEIAMMMTIALRFIPTLMEEVDKIMKAQISRGADFDTGGIMQKAKSMIPLLVPLFISAFRRADELALAMEARCYQGDVNRTRMKELRFKKNDGLFFSLLFVFALGIVLTRFI